MGVRQNGDCQVMDLVTQLRRDEGVRYTPYRDTLGLLTVGVGRCLDRVPFSDDEVNLMLANDIVDKQKQLQQFPWFTALDDVRKAAVVNMAFNLGVHGLLGFPHAIAALAKQDWATANSELLDSVWSRQVGDRANRIALQILSGQWQ